MSQVSLFVRFVGDSPYTTRNGENRHSFIFEDEAAKNPMFNRFRVGVNAAQVPSMPDRGESKWYTFETSIYQNRVYLSEYLGETH